MAYPDVGDLSKATRELFVKSLRSQILYKTPVVESILSRNKMTVSGGKFIERLIDTDEIDSLVQDYATNEALSNSKKDTLAKPRFYWKKSTIPLQYDVDEETENILAGSTEQLLDLAQHLTKKAQRGMKLWLEKSIFNSAVTTVTSRTDTDKYCQSLVSALSHSMATYGTIARSFTSNGYWLGADPAGLTASQTATSQTTATNMTINNLRKWVYESDVSHYKDDNGDIEIYMCPSLFNKVRAEMESKIQYKPTGDTQKQGFSKMDLDGMTIVEVPYLQKSSTTKTWVFVLNMNEFELRIHKDRNFKLTDFVWQGQNANGYDYMLARILFKGNFITWKPNASMWLSNVS